MKIKFYPSPFNDGNYTVDEIKLGHIWLYADVECDECGKNQSWANANGFCIRCGCKL